MQPVCDPWNTLLLLLPLPVTVAARMHENSEEPVAAYTDIDDSFKYNTLRAVLMTRQCQQGNVMGQDP
jgi:hypothetical protein